MNVQRYSSQDRLIADLLKSVAFEELWQQDDTTKRTITLLQIIANAFQVNSKSLAKAHNSVRAELASLPARLNINVRLGKVWSDKKSMADLLERLGVYCLIQIANGTVAEDDIATQTRNRSSSMQNIAISLPSPLSTDRESFHSATSDNEADPLLTTLVGRFSLDSVASAKSARETSGELESADDFSGPVINVTPADEEVLFSDGKCCPGSYSHLLRQRSDSYRSNSNQAFNKTKRIPGKRTNCVSKNGGTFKTPVIDFENAACTKNSELIVSVWFEDKSYKTSSPVALLVSNTLPRSDKLQLKQNCSSTSKLRSFFGSPLKPTKSFDQNMCQGLARLPLKSTPLKTYSLSKPGQESDKCFKIEMKVEITLQTAKFSETSGTDVDKWLQRLYELYRVFYNYQFTKVDKSSNEVVTEDVDYLLEIYRRHKGITLEIANIVELAALVSLRQSQHLDKDVLLSQILVANQAFQTSKLVEKSELFERTKDTFLRTPLPEFLSEMLQEIEHSPSLLQAYPLVEGRFLAFVQHFVNASEILQTCQQLASPSNLQEKLTDAFDTMIKRDVAAVFYEISTANQTTTPVTPVLPGFSLINPAIKLATAVVDPTAQIDQRIEKLTNCFDEAVQLLSNANADCLAKLRQIGFNYQLNALVSIDQVASPYVKHVLADLEAYREANSKYVNNLTITAKLSFKLYCSVLEFVHRLRLLSPNLKAKSGLSGNLEIFEGFIDYWLFAFRHLALERVQKSVDTDLLEPVNERLAISWSAVEVSSLIVSDLIGECRKIATNADDILSMVQEAMDVYFSMITRQANATADARTEPFSLTELVTFSDRLMRALNNVDHVFETVCQALANDHFAASQAKKLSKKRRSVIEQLLENFKSTMEPLIEAYLINAVVNLGDDILAGSRTLLEKFFASLKPDEAKALTVRLWQICCQVLWCRLMLSLDDEREFRFYKRLLSFVTHWRDEFVSFGLTEDELTKDDNFGLIWSALKDLAKTDNDLIYTYLLHMTNYGEGQQNSSNLGTVKEGEIDIMLGKVTEEGLLVASVHDIRSAFEPYANHYAKVSIRPDISTVTSQVQLVEQNSTKRFEFSSLPPPLLKEKSRTQLVIIEIWRRNYFCSSYVGEVVIPLYSVPSFLSKQLLNAAAISRVPFYQPKRIANLLKIMSTRKSVSPKINNFLRWRLEHFLKLDANCIARAEGSSSSSSSSNQQQQQQPSSFLHALLVENESRRLMLQLAMLNLKQTLMPNCFVQRQWPVDD